MSILWGVSFFLVSCVSPSLPLNLEPEIAMLPAAEVTRTEALLSASVNMHGTTELDFAAFRYGPVGTEGTLTRVAVSESNTYALRLLSLTPATLYWARFETGTSEVTIHSDEIQFTTLPTSLPAVAGITLLSWSPQSLLIEINIADTGGSPLLEVGCEVKTPSGDSVCEKLTPSDIAAEKYRLAINGLQPQTTYVLIPYVINNSGKTCGSPTMFTTQESIYVSQPGELSSLLGMAVDLQHIAIRGKINGSDLRHLRLLLGARPVDGQSIIAGNLSSLDLSDAEIVEGGESYDGNRLTVNGEVSTGVFADCHRLQTIRLPQTATAIHRNAFARSKNIEAIEIGEHTISILPSDDCPALREITVSKGNPQFSTIDGVLYNHDLTSILWFPSGRAGEYLLPSTVTRIGEYAFSGARISHISLPATLSTIGVGAFASSQVTALDLPQALSDIPESMCQNCTLLSSVRFGEKVNHLGRYSFAGTSLRNIYLNATIPPVMSSNAFGTSEQDTFLRCTLHVPAESVEIYRNHPRWGQFEDIVEL